MSSNLLFLLFSVAIKSGFGLDCSQIPSTSIFAGNIVHLPGPSDQLQIIPANWKCLYKISAPANTTHGLSANVMIRNGLKGVNDIITVVDIMGSSHVLNSRTKLNEEFTVIPGAEMTVEVVTKSVYMQSMFEITVEYSNVQIGPTFAMKTDGEMNYIDVASLRDGKSKFNTVTFVGTEPIHVEYAHNRKGIAPTCSECVFAIDGTIDNQTEIRRFSGLDNYPFTTTSNAITIISSTNEFSGYVFNTKSEVQEFPYLSSIAVDNTEYGASVSGWTNDTKVWEVVNFEKNGIIMEEFEIESKTCTTAYVISGPPNNSSKVLLDFTTSPEMPHFFDVKYFSVVVADCDFAFGVQSF